MQHATDSKTPAATGAVRSRSPRTRTLQFALFALLAAVVLGLNASQRAGAAAGSSAITVKAFELNADGTKGAALDQYTFIVNVDNSPSPDNPNPLARPGTAAIPSHSPTVAEGNQDHATVQLPDNNPYEKYLISMRSPGHKMWGTWVTLPKDAGQVDVLLRATPVPLGKLVVHVYNDHNWTNGAPDEGEGGLAGFKVTLEDQIDGQVAVDYNNQPLCGGACVTDANGDVTIPNLSPATYFIYVTPPDSSWTQTTTIDGGFALQASVIEGDDGLGAPGETIWEGPNATTAWDFGFAQKSVPFSAPGTGTITGTARNWVGWPPFDALSLGDPVPNPYVALTDSATDATVYVGQGDAQGNFSIENVPNGTYNVSIWDEQLSYIMRFTTVTITGGAPVDMGDVGVSRWFGWLSGYVYQDIGKAADGTVLGPGTAGNGIRDCVDPIDFNTCEPGIPNFPMDQRWRDGSIKEDTVTTDRSAPQGPGYYEYPTAEGGALGKWVIGEVGFDRFGTEPGASVHDEINPSKVTHICADPVGAPPATCNTSLGGGLLTNQLLSEGHRAVVDWGKRPYAPGEAGQIVGITYYATTRNEFYGYTATNETYEAAIPGVEVRLEGVGPDGLPNTADDVVLNDYFTDQWQHPSKTTDGQTCDVTDMNGNDLSALLNPNLGPYCLETPLVGQETKDGAFDGGYAFADYCPATTGGLNVDQFVSTHGGTSICKNGTSPVPLDPGTYITHFLAPKDSSDTRTCNRVGSTWISEHADIANGAAPQQGCLYRPEQEEDVNVDLGAQYLPAIPPPPCTGDDHVIDQTTLTNRSPYFGVAGAHAPLCDKKLVVLKANQNANADFFLMTNEKNGVEVATPGRVVGSVFDDIYFDRDVKSIWYGEPRPIKGIPVGIYDYKFRLITTLHTDDNGAYTVVLPSTETFNCPIPQGPCPGMYVAIVDDPGTKAHPNAGFNPNYLTANTPFDIWPGQSTQLDTPIDPVSGTACELVSGTPELLQVSKPYVRPSDSTATLRRITIDGVNFGASAGSLSLTDSQSRALSSRTYTGLATAAQLANLNVGGIVSWTDRQIVVQVPATHAAILVPPTAPFYPGQYQVMITNAAAAGGFTTPNGITVHALGAAAGGQPAYNPPIVQVAVPTLGGHELQSAIDGAAANSLVVLSPGIYRENVILWKPLKLQGVGVGGTIGIVEPGGPPIEDPRFNVQGSAIDGRFFRENEASWTAVLNAHPLNGLGNPADVPGTNKTDISKGADITIIAVSSGANAFSGTGVNAAKIDGIGIQDGQGSFGGGGIMANAYARNLQVTNNVVDSNHGQIGGGVVLGTPYRGNQHNENVLMRWNRVQASGGVKRGGGITVFNGSDNYEVANNYMCSNFSNEYGGAFSHWGKSPNGSLHDNTIVYNDAFDSGGAISISEEIPQPVGSIPWTDPRRGSGTVNIVRNVIEFNYSGDDGGAMFIQNTLGARINVVNNFITNNGAADLGGAIIMDDASNVAFVNNTVTMNASTASSETSDGLQHSGGLAIEANDTNYQATLPAGSPDFSDPVAFFNNIFWNNEACTLNKSTVPPTLNGCTGELAGGSYIDFEIHGTTGPRMFSNARYNLFTNGSVLQSNRSMPTLPGSTTASTTGFPTDPATNGNLIGVNPAFNTPVATQFSVAPSRLDPQVAAVTILVADPPVSLTGNYHLITTLASNQVSGAVDRGVRCSNQSVPPPAPTTAAPIGPPCSAGAVEAPFVDIDGQNRVTVVGGFQLPMLRTPRVRTPWDLGADEVPTTSPIG